MRVATYAGWCWLRQTGAGPRRMRSVSPRTRPMKTSGTTIDSYFMVWCSPIQNSLKPSSSARTTSSMSSSKHWDRGLLGGWKGMMNMP